MSRCAWNCCDGDCGNGCGPGCGYCGRCCKCPKAEPEPVECAHCGADFTPDDEAEGDEREVCQKCLHPRIDPDREPGDDDGVEYGDPRDVF